MPADADPLPLSATPSIASAFLIGRDPDGHWLAVETHGRGGGIFIDAEAAVHYARGETSRRPGAVIVSHDVIRGRLA